MARGSASSSRYFNPRPPRGGRPYKDEKSLMKMVISIHAPREGGDVVLCFHQECGVCISIHAPREGGDVCVEQTNVPESISIHAPREGGDVRFPPDGTGADISIHAPREGGDVYIPPITAACRVFQSTPPARGATT